MPFAETERQKQVLEAVIKRGSKRAAARELGLSEVTVRGAVDRIEKNAARRGYSPDHDMVHTAPDGYRVKGVSTLYTDNGVAAQWVKTDVDRERQEALMREAIEAMSSDIKREKPVAQKTKSTNVDLLNLYVITDFHIGAYAWGEETGSDWDSEIAENLLVAWFQKAIEASPNAAQAVLAQMGDLLHYDSLEAVTPEHHNILDADTRFEKLVRIVIRVLRRVVRMLLEKHDSVHLIMAEGNHDPASSVWLREWFAALYEDEPRVTVDQTPSPYYAYEWGETSLFVHHGHRRSPKSVDQVFAAKFREMFGRTKHAYAHLGHKHRAELIESPLMKVEQHPTLAAPDAFSARGGYISSRSASAITYHREYGEVSRVTISPELAGA